MYTLTLSSLHHPPTHTATLDILHVCCMSELSRYIGKTGGGSSISGCTVQPGFYGNAGQGIAAACPSGTSSSPGVATISACFPMLDYYGILGAAATPCPIGKSQQGSPATSTTTLASCDAKIGYYGTPSDTSQVFAKCPAGKTSSDGDAAATINQCVVASGYFGTAGSGNATPCPAGRTSLAAQTSLSDCTPAPGFYGAGGNFSDIDVIQWQNSNTSTRSSS